MEQNRNLWNGKVMEQNRNSWNGKVMEWNGNSWNGKLWNRMGIHGMEWEFVEWGHEMEWELVEGSSLRMGRG